MQVPVIDLTAVYPEVIVAFIGLSVLAIDIFSKRERKTLLSVIALIGLSAALLTMVYYFQEDKIAFSGMVAADPYAQFFKMIFILAAAFTILMSPRYLRLFNINVAEYFELILFATLGMMVMVAANDLVAIYIGLELMAISIYLMAGFQKDNPRSGEASIKYFLLGAFASAILLYGMSFLYGITGTTNLQEIARNIEIPQSIYDPKLLGLSLVLITIGFAFKIAAVPFHMWTPDVYEGAPTPLTAFMSVGPKVAGFAVIMRVYITVFDTLASDWIKLFWLLALLTMIVGNIAAVAQQSVKRMLAYSSIAHAGYLLIGVVSAGSALGLTQNSDINLLLTGESMTSVMVYLFAYMFMNLGAFAVLIALARADDPRESLEDFAGLAKRRPLTAMLMTILMLSLAGIPGTFGFVGKFYIFKAAIQTQNMPLAVIGVIMSVVSAFYYIRVIVYMYMREPEGEAPAEDESAGSTMYAAVSTTLFTVVFGLYPVFIIEMARFTISQMLV